MPMQRQAVLAAGEVMASPWMNRVDHQLAIVVDPDTFATGEVDANGYLKPGVPLLRTGLLVTAGAVFGCNLEAVKIAKTNGAADRTAAPNIEVAVGLEGSLNRAVLEDILGRVLTAAEIAGFALAPCTIKLIA